MLKRIEPVTICDQFTFLFFTQLKHKITWESFYVSFYSLIQYFCTITALTKYPNF